MRYLLYGLQVQTDQPLPGLRAEPGVGPADVRAWIGAHPPGCAPSAVAEPWHLGDRPATGGEPALAAFRAADGSWLRLRYADGTEFTVDRAGTRVGCTWRPGSTLEDTSTYLLGPVCGLLLRLRGLTCLHAGALAAHGAAWLLCGPGGAGKSTTTAALAARGHAVLADDAAVLDESPAGVTVRPAYPHLRLWPDAVRALFGAGAQLPALTPNWEKRSLDLGERDGAFHPHPLPVRAVYLIGPRESAGAPRLAPAAAADAVLALAANSYLAWLPELAAQGRDLGRYARLVREAAVVRVVPHADARRLPGLCALLEADFAARAAGRDG
ncbi:MAG: hypothetical protein ACJ8GN_13585 [Longimicrobiaceae bacterium]